MAPIRRKLMNISDAKITKLPKNVSHTDYMLLCQSYGTQDAVLLMDKKSFESMRKAFVEFKECTEAKKGEK